MRQREYSNQCKRRLVKREREMKMIKNSRKRDKLWGNMEKHEEEQSVNGQQIS